MKKILLVMITVTSLLACQNYKDQIPQSKTSGTYKQLTNAELNNFLASNKGKVVLINFFATWCPPCRKEIPDLISLANQYKGKDVTIISISVDENGEEAVKPFAEQVGFNYPVYLTTQELTATYNIDAIPQTFLYDKNGKLITNLRGYVEAEQLRKMIDSLL